VTYPGALASNPDFIALRNEVRMLRSRVDTSVSASTRTMTSSPKRFRIGIFTVPLTVAGAVASGTVKWSTPMPTKTYAVDAACSAFPNQPLVPAISQQAEDGCTVSFTTPVLLAAGTIVVVLAVSSATS
jgi:hypothetical protein